MLWENFFLEGRKVGERESRLWEGEEEKEKINEEVGGKKRTEERKDESEDREWYKEDMVLNK